MIYDTAYYVLATVRVYLAAALLIIVLPMIVWRHYLHGKNYAFRFIFCIITQNCFYINLVLLLGFLKWCNVYTILLGIVLEFLLVGRCTKPEDSLPLQTRLSRWWEKRQKRLKKPTPRAVLLQLRDKVLSVRELTLWTYIRRNALPLLLLTAALVYNAIYLTHGVNVDHSYQFSDIPVHQSWIYALEHGSLFEYGIYPFAMHSVIYVIRVLTGLDLRDILLYYGSFQTLLLLLCTYCVARQMFCGRYIAFLPVIGFSLLMNNVRYGGSLPQECGMFAVMALFYFMLRFFRSDRKAHDIPGDTGAKKFFRVGQYMFHKSLNTDVIMIMLSVSVIIAYHFYTAIAAIVLVGCLIMAYLPRFVRKQYLVPLVFAGFFGVVIAVAPFGIALAKGIPFQASMAWATGVISGETTDDANAAYVAALQGDTAPTTDVTAMDGTDEEVKKTRTLQDWITDFRVTILNFGKESLYGEDSATLMLWCIALVALVGVGFLFFKPFRKTGQGYIAVSLYVAIMCVMASAGTLGLITLIIPYRISVFIQPVLFILYAIPIDFIFRLLYKLGSQAFHAVLTAVSVAVCGLTGFGIAQAGWFHKDLQYDIFYYNESEYVMRHIKQDFPDLSYIVVSPTDEYYEVVDHGFHTELSEFVNMVDGGEKVFTFPSENVFFFIEKTVLSDYYYGKADVSPTLARETFQYRASDRDYVYQRAILESKAYYWAQECLKKYPNNFSVYFEDDVYVVYLLRQNTYYPFNLQFDYLAALPAGETTVTP